MQSPVLSNVTVEPDTVQTVGVVEEKAIDRADVAVADTATVLLPKRLVSTAKNVIDCAPVGVTEFDGSDAALVPFPLVAVTENV